MCTFFLRESINAKERSVRNLILKLMNSSLLLETTVLSISGQPLCTNRLDLYTGAI